MRKRWGEALYDRDEQRAMKRQAVLRAGARLFHERGYEQTYLDDIAAELGVSKPSLYYYVKNKEEILYEVVQASLAMATTAFDVADREGASGREKALIFFRHYVDHLFSDFGKCAAGVDIRALDAQLEGRILAVRHDIDRRVRAYVQEGQRDGSIQGSDAVLTTYYVFGALNWIGQWHRGEAARDPHEVSRAFLELTERLLASPPRS